MLLRRAITTQHSDNNTQYPYIDDLHDIHDDVHDNIITSTPTTTPSSISSSVQGLLDDIFKESSYLVHPYDDTKSQQQHELSHVPPISTSTIPKQQWKKHHDYIHNLIL